MASLCHTLGFKNRESAYVSINMDFRQHNLCFLSVNPLKFAEKQIFDFCTRRKYTLPHSSVPLPYLFRTSFLHYQEPYFKDIFGHDFYAFEPYVWDPNLSLTYLLGARPELEYCWKLGAANIWDFENFRVGYNLSRVYNGVTETPFFLTSSLLPSPRGVYFLR